MNINQHDLSDDELDNLFRNSAEEFELDFNADSWTKMSQKLDAALPQSSSRAVSSRLKQGLSLLIGLLLLIGGYYFYQSSSRQSNEMQSSANQINEKTQTDDTKQKYVGTDKVDTDNLNSKENNGRNTTLANDKTQKNSSVIISDKTIAATTKENLLEEKNSIKTTVKETDFEDDNINVGKNITAHKRNKSAEKVLSKNNTQSSKNQVLKKRNSSELRLNSFSEKQNKTQKTGSIFSKIDSKQTRVFEKENDIAQISANINNVNIQKEELITSNTEQKDIRLALKDLSLLSPKHLLIQSNFNLPQITFEEKVDEIIIPKSQSTAFKKGLYFRLAISPDLSLITTDEITKLGSNWAALIEYRFNNHFSVQTGVIRSMKYYDSYPESYEWPYNWPNPPVLVDINATCKMLDVPLNIRYDITQKPNSRWFVSSGMTSYFMLKEKYVYNYENPADPKIKWKNWEGKTGPYYLGTINFSMGYERQIFRKLSLQAEPFFKMPISKVGFGQVHLSTIGIFLSAKYPL